MKKQIIETFELLIIAFCLTGLWCALELLFKEGIHPSKSDTVIALITSVSLQSNIKNWIKNQIGATK